MAKSAENLDSHRYIEPKQNSTEGFVSEDSLLTGTLSSSKTLKLESSHIISSSSSSIKAPREQIPIW